MSGRLRVGQAGLGYWGRNLARNFDDLTELRWLCDASEERQAEFAERYPQARVTGDFDELLAADDVDAVVIATPVPTHHPLARAALQAGKHVFVEIGRHSRVGVAPAEPLAQLRVEVDEPREIGELVEVAHEVRAPVAQARHRDARHSFQTLPSTS